MKLVSVYINAYNAERFILETLNSLLNQTYKNLQILVVGDKTTEKTAEILTSVNDERLEVCNLTQQSSGPLITALKHVKGDYVAYVDAGVLCTPDEIEKQVAYLEAHDDCSLCITSINAHSETAGQLCFLTTKELLDHADLQNPTFPFLNNPDLWNKILSHTNVHVVGKSTICNKTSSSERIEKLEKEIKNLKEQIKAKNQALGRLSEENHRVNSLYAEIANSFFWRLTGPARKIMQRIKNFLSRHPRLLAICIFLKCLLREGYFPAKQKYRAFLPKANQKKLFEISDSKRKQQESTKFTKEIKISVLVPLYNTPEKFLIEMIDSVRNQTYKNWELCLADGSDKDHNYVGSLCQKIAAKDPRIVYKKLEKNLGISENTNACIEISSGNYIGLFDHDDLLHPSALFETAKAIESQNADMVYTDEVTFLGKVSNIVNFALKPDYAPDTLRSYNYICHFTTFSRELMEKAGGGFRPQFDGSQDYDLILRLTEQAKNVVHIAKPLYFWRSHEQSTASSISAKPYIIEAAHKALTEHLTRIGLKGKVQDGVAPSIYRMNYDIIGEPLISIVIPNKDHTDDLDKCLQSIFEKTTYSNYEILIVENNSTEPETFEYYEKIKQHEKVQVLYWEREFNYSAINNFGVKQARGDYILLLNNDVEILTGNWLQEMLMFAQRNDMGAVGVKLYYPDDTVQHAGVILGIGGVAGHSHKYFKKEDPGFMARASIIQNLSACTAACLMIPRKVYDEVGGLDEGYAVAFNDVDLCMKIREAGYLIVYTPYAELYHYESKSRGFEDSPEKVARFRSEIERFQSRWGKELEQGDPYYNPNLTLTHENFGVEIREQ